MKFNSSLGFRETACGVSPIITRDCYLRIASTEQDDNNDPHHITRTHPIISSGLRSSNTRPHRSYHGVFQCRAQNVSSSSNRFRQIPWIPFDWSNKVGGAIEWTTEGWDGWLPRGLRLSTVLQREGNEVELNSKFRQVSSDFPSAFSILVFFFFVLP